MTDKPTDETTVPELMVRVENGAMQAASRDADPSRAPDMPPA
jgi:hypothetical protein